MTSSFPGGNRSFTPRVDLADTVYADDVNSLQEEVRALEVKINGTTPSSGDNMLTSTYAGTFAATATWTSLYDRLNNIEAGLVNGWSTSPFIRKAGGDVIQPASGTVGLVVKNVAGTADILTTLDSTNTAQFAINYDGKPNVAGAEVLYVGSSAYNTLQSTIAGTATIQGTQGVQGTTGIQGARGLQGLQGFVGTTGSTGSTGSQGTTGTQGIQGRQGTTGAQGITGSGSQGTSGLQGTTGATGSQGTTGIQGLTGTQGTQGIQGTNTTTAVINAQSTNYTLALADQDKFVTVAGLGAQYVSIPTNAGAALPIGSVVHLAGVSSGTFTIQAVTPGTTAIQSVGATPTAPKLRTQYSAADVLKIATDTWLVVGDIV